MNKVLFLMWGHVSDKLSVELPDVSKTIESREVMREVSNYKGAT